MRRYRRLHLRSPAAGSRSPAASRCMQPRFTRELLAQAKRARPAHRARHLRVPRQPKPTTPCWRRRDLVLLDIKAGSGETHRRLTRHGVEPHARVRPAARGAAASRCGCGTCSSRATTTTRRRSRRSRRIAARSRATSSASTCCRSTSSARTSTSASACTSRSMTTRRRAPSSTSRVRDGFAAHALAVRKVPGVGLEPTRPIGQSGLSRSRLANSATRADCGS